MAYNPLIPGANDLLSQSQNDIQNNFAILETFVNVDHAGFASDNIGKHNRVTFPNQTASPVFAGTDLGLFNKVFTGTGATAINELFVNKLTGTTTHKDIPLTASILSTNSVPAALSAGWTYLPSGILLKWGNSTTGTVTFSTAQPAFTVCIVAFVQNYVAGGTAGTDRVITVQAITATGFQVFARLLTGAPTGVVEYNWLAIGY